MKTATQVDWGTRVRKIGTVVLARDPERLTNERRPISEPWSVDGALAAGTHGLASDHGLDGANEYGVRLTDGSRDDIEHLVNAVYQVDVSVPGVAEEDFRSLSALVFVAVCGFIVGAAVGFGLDDTPGGVDAIDVTVHLDTEQASSDGLDAPYEVAARRRG